MVVITESLTTLQRSVLQLMAGNFQSSKQFSLTIHNGMFTIVPVPIEDLPLIVELQKFPTIRYVHDDVIITIPVELN